MEAWFFTSIFRCSTDVERAQVLFPQIASQWARRLCFTPNNASDQIDITIFRRVRRIFLEYNGVKSALCFGNITVAVGAVELDILNNCATSLPFLISIRTAFPSLRVLRIRQVMPWCHLCNIHNFLEFSRAPQTITYTGGVGLPIHFARVLSALQHLHTVEFSSAYFLNRNAGTYDLDDNSLLWTGECTSCMLLLSSDEEFRDEILAKKKSPIIRPPSLEIVRWSFLMNGEIEECSSSSESEEDGENDEIGDL
ncbi:hypothetical protein HGRIS_014110 [Hohenbuehelia grisea]|uniref:Uncharacterized protein n=1 Tax=Hohenbuehelia grisea TaxID=104357 RepID=A0ABR3JSF3_9AGAR